MLEVKMDEEEEGVSADAPRRELVDEYLHHVWERRRLGKQGERYSSDWEHHDTSAVLMWAREMTPEERASAKTRHDAARENEANGADVRFAHPGHVEAVTLTLGDAVSLETQA